MDLVWKSMGRGWLLSGCVAMSVDPCRSVACDRPDHEAGDGVDNDRDQEERETDFDERAEVDVAGGLGELSGDDAGEGVGWSEERLADIGMVADDHGDGHRLPQCAPEAE